MNYVRECTWAGGSENNNRKKKKKRKKEKNPDRAQTKLNIPSVRYDVKILPQQLEIWDK